MNIHGLNPCPFCGKDEYLDYRVNISEPDKIANYTIICVSSNGRGNKGCGTVLGYSRSIDDATKKWNTRAGETK